MSHTGILDKDWTAFCQDSADLHSVESIPEKPPKNKRKLPDEDRQEADFNCEAFVDVSAKMISQFFQ